MVWLKFAICVLVIFFLGKKVARYGDIIADKTGLGGVWVGLVIISLVTSLPELFTGISAITIVDAPDLTIGNIFGANTYNLLNLALLDMMHKNGSLFRVIGPGHRMTAWFSLSITAIAAIAVFISHQFSPVNLGWIGWYTPVIIIIYIIAIRMLFLHEQKQPTISDNEIKLLEENDIPLKKVYIYFAISSLLIIGAGTWLALIGDEIALSYGWGQSFVGNLFIGFSTTLPEITVSFAAMRLGAVDIAVANMIGSNLFNMTIVAIDDLIYTKGSVLSAVSEIHLQSALVVIIMTAILLIGLYVKPKRFFRFSWLNCLLLVLFFVGAYFSFSTV